MARQPGRDVVVARICLGLGNQMFQYALGRHLALTSGRALRLDLSPYETDPVRRFALDQFAITTPLAERYQLRTARRRGSVGLMDRLRGRVPSRLIQQRQFQFDPTVPAEAGSIILSGYWQSERYFAGSAETLREDFRLAAPMRPERRAVLADIAGCKAVSVHVRRGDYVADAKTLAFHGALSADWYARSMARMTERLGDDARFFLFSEEPEVARAMLPRALPIVTVPCWPDGRDAEDLHLMAACRGHIIANSTFSWWGAWLDPRPDKAVIAPTRWFAATHVDTRDVLPPAWERLDVAEVTP